MMRALTPAQRRRPDWRWRTTVEIIDQSEAAADPATARAAMLRRHDDLVRRAVAFKLAIDGGLDLGPFTDLSDAYEVMTNDAPQRLQVECLLLGGADDPTITALTGLDERTVSAFGGLFFDTRGRPRLWFTSVLFQGCFVGRDLTGDEVGVQHRLAWALGWEAFVDMQTGRPTGRTRAAVLQLADDLIAQQLSRAILTTGDPDQQVRLASALALRAPADRDAGGPGSTDADFGAAILGFLTSVQTRVADPSAPENANLPAREPRAHEYEVQVLESSRSVSINELAPARLPANR